MTSDPYVNLYTSDFLAGTSGMTAATKGVYITLLCLMYEAEAPLSQSWAVLARRCGCTLPSFKRAIAEMQEEAKVTVSDEGIWSEKCDKHIARRRERRIGAKAAADERWRKTQQKQSKSDTNAMRKPCQPEPEPEPEKKRDSDESLVNSDPQPANSAAEAVSVYNRAAEKAGWSRVQKMTPARSKALKKRLEECGGIEGWREVMKKAWHSDFLRGRSDPVWKGFSFDWMIKQANFVKIMEGNYDNRADDTGNARAKAAAERFAARRMAGGEDRDADVPLLSAQRAEGCTRGGDG